MIALAVIDEDWSRDHVKTVKRLEEEVGRQICGAPTSSGLPCKDWPIDESHGRCSQHKPSASSSPDESESTTDKQRTVSDESDGSSLEMNEFRYWLLLGFIGLFLGGAAAASYLATDYSGWWRPKKKVSVDQSGGEDPTSINVNDPDFGQIFQDFQEGRRAEVLRTLEAILNESDSRVAKSRAMYYKYVFLQKQEQFEQSVGVAEKFVNEYRSHAQRPEVLYGAGLMCEQYIPDGCDTEFHSILREQYPDSKWIDELSPSS